MRFKTWFLSAAAVMVVVTLAAGCSSSAPTPTSVPIGPVDTPDAQATIDALVRSQPGRTPTPTVVPEKERALALEFATAHAVLVRDWDRFHLGLDTWREGLDSCDPSALQAALGRFARDFSGIAQAVGSLPRSPAVGELSTMLSGALEGEAKALRRLRDGWIPGDSSLFEDVEIQGAVSAAVQARVGDQLSGMQERAREESRIGVRVYSTGVERLNSAWDSFHQSYDEFRAEEADLSSVEVVGCLSALIARLRENVVDEVVALPTTPATLPVSEVLAGAVEEEDLALRRLRGTFEKKEVQSDPSDSADPSDPSDSAGSSDLSDSVFFEPRDLSLFDAFDAQLVATNTARRRALVALAEVLPGVSEEREAQVGAFSAGYQELTTALAAFHRGYDQWQGGEGECNRGAAVDSLGDFSISFSRIAERARQLPQATFLRPLGALLIEAAEVEVRALRGLRNEWRPFDSSVYGAFDGERDAAGKLRRQVAVGLQDLLARYQIPYDEVGTQ